MNVARRLVPLLCPVGLAALALIWWARPFTWLYRLPGMRWIEEKVYRWIANNRYRMPGSTAACAVPNTPDEIRNT